MSDNSKLIGATMVGTMVGITSMIAMQGMAKDQKTKQKEAKLQRQRERLKKRLQNQMIEDFLNDADQVQLAQKEKGCHYATHVSLNQLHSQQGVKNYSTQLIFNEDDEVIEKSPERSQTSNDENMEDGAYDELTKQTNDDNKLKHQNSQKRLSEPGLSSIQHNFGDTVYSQGTNKIDLRKFIGPRSKVEACADFVGNIVQIQQKHLEKHEQMKEKLVEEHNEQPNQDDVQLTDREYTDFTSQKQTEMSLIDHKMEQNESMTLNKDEKMLSMVNEDDGKQMDKRDAIFMAFIADYSWDAIKQKNKNVKLPAAPAKLSLQEKNRLEKIEKQKQMDDQFRRMTDSMQREFQKQRAKKIMPYKQ